MAGRPRSRPSGALAVLALTALTLVSACSTRTVGGSGMTATTTAAGDFAGVAPVLSVERFLQAVNAQDYTGMSRLFGTVDGPVEGTREEIELRMATIAQILRHEDYRIESERMEPGRTVVTRRVGVDLTIAGRLIPDVYFMMVQMENGRWMVQEIDLEKVTGA